MTNGSEAPLSHFEAPLSHFEAMEARGIIVPERSDPVAPPPPWPGAAMNWIRVLVQIEIEMHTNGGGAALFESR